MVLAFRAVKPTSDIVFADVDVTKANIDISRTTDFGYPLKAKLYIDKDKDNGVFIFNGSAFELAEGLVESMDIEQINTVVEEAERKLNDELAQHDETSEDDCDKQIDMNEFISEYFKTVGLTDFYIHQLLAYNRKNSLVFEDGSSINIIRTKLLEVLNGWIHWIDIKSGSTSAVKLEDFVTNIKIGNIKLRYITNDEITKVREIESETIEGSGTASKKNTVVRHKVVTTLGYTDLDTGKPFYLSYNKKLDRFLIGHNQNESGNIAIEMHQDKATNVYYFLYNGKTYYLTECSAHSKSDAHKIMKDLMYGNIDFREFKSRFSYSDFISMLVSCGSGEITFSKANIDKYKIEFDIKDLFTDGKLRLHKAIGSEYIEDFANTRAERFYGLICFGSFIVDVD